MISERLQKEFGTRSIFIDVDTIPLGIDFRSYINDAVSKCDVLLAIIGDNWLATPTDASKRRITERTDFVRIEIEAALARDIPVVPVLVGVASMPVPEVLPESLRPLAFRNAAEVRSGRHLTSHLEALVSGLRFHFSRQLSSTQTVADNTHTLTAKEYFERALEAVDPADRIRFYTRAIQLKSDFAEAFNNRGVLRAGRGDAAGAREDYGMAIQLKPEFAEAFINRGDLRKGHREPGAREDYDAAIRLEPDNAVAYRSRGNLRVVEDPQGALDDYATAIRLKPDYAEAFYSRGCLRHSQGDAAGARADYDTAIQLKPHFADTFYSRGLLRAEQGERVEARADFDMATKLKPEFAEAFYSRGVLRAEQGDRAGAREDYDIAIALRPDYADALNNRGNLRREQGDTVGAWDDYDTALKLTFHPEASLNRGLLRHAAGKFQAAVKDFNRALRSNPDFRRHVRNREPVVAPIARNK